MNYFPYKLKRNQLYSIEGQPCVFTSHGYGTRLNFEHAATGKPVEYLDDAGVVRPMDQDRFRTLLQNGQFFQMAERGQSPAKNKIARPPNVRNSIPKAHFGWQRYGCSTGTA